MLYKSECWPLKKTDLSHFQRTKQSIIWWMCYVKADDNVKQCPALHKAWLGWISIQKFGFINRVDNANWPPYRDSKS